MANNAWSVFNNYQAGESDHEAIRSLFLFGMDVAGFIISKIPYKNLSNPAEIAQVIGGGGGNGLVGDKLLFVQHFLQMRRQGFAAPFEFVCPIGGIMVIVGCQPCFGVGAHLRYGNGFVRYGGVFGWT